MAQTQVSQAKNWVNGNNSQYGLGTLSDETRSSVNIVGGVALRDCSKLYEESESRLSRMVSSDKSSYTKEDALTWVSAVMTNHRTCLDGLQEKGHVEAHQLLSRKNLTTLLGQALILYSKTKVKGKGK